jgi:hypothetical protein
MASWESIVVDGLKSVLESPEGQAEATALITSGEADLTSLVTNAVKNVKPPGGLAGIAVGALETPIVNAILANFKADPQALLTAIDADVDAWAKSLGG